MKNIAYSIIALSFGFLLSSCEKKFDREVFPHSTPVVESAKLTSVKDSNSSSITYGDSIEFTAVVTDVETPLSTVTLNIISNHNKLIFSSKEIVRGRSDELKVKYKIPFLSDLESQIPDVQIIVENAEGDQVQYNLPADNNLNFNRPVFGDYLYVVTEANSVFKLPKLVDSEYQYSLKGLDIEDSDFKYKIAEKIDADGQIDYSGFVWGNSDDIVTTIDENSGISLSFDNSNNTIITGLNFNTYSFEDSIKTREKNLRVVGGSKLSIGTYNGYSSAIIQFTNGKEVSFEGFTNLANSINPDFFKYESVNKATFIGLTGTYSVHYNLTTGFLYIEQTSAVAPNALWICGVNLGFPQKKYAATTQWAWDVPSNYIFCRKVSDGLFEATFYANSDFNFKFFNQRTWGGEQKSDEYTTTSDLWASNSEGNWVATDKSTDGVYKATIDINAKTANLVKLN